MNNQEDSYVQWLNLYDWEGFLTVRLPGDVHPVKAYPHLVEDVLRPLARFLKTRLAALTVTSFGHSGLQRPHIHVLLTSKEQQLALRMGEAQTFLEYSKEKRTQLNTHGAALDLLPFHEERHLHYTANHILDRSDVNYYDKKLLEAIKNKGATP